MKALNHSEKTSAIKKFMGAYTLTCGLIAAVVYFLTSAFTSADQQGVSESRILNDYIRYTADIQKQNNEIISKIRSGETISDDFNDLKRSIDEFKNRSTPNTTFLKFKSNLNALLDAQLWYMGRLEAERRKLSNLSNQNPECDCNKLEKEIKELQKELNDSKNFAQNNASSPPLRDGTATPPATKEVIPKQLSETILKYYKELNEHAEKCGSGKLSIQQILKRSLERYYDYGAFQGDLSSQYNELHKALRK